jgi:hypothetical protein
MVFFCCKKPQFNQIDNSVILVDVDGTLISSADNTLNMALLEALRGKEVVFLTKMSMREVQEQVANSDYVTRRKLIERLAKEYSIKVSLVITPIDLAEDMQPGDGYKNYIAPWAISAEREELTLENMGGYENYLAACREFTAKYEQVNAAYHAIDTKGALARKFFDQNPHLKAAYFLDDQQECIDSVTVACRERSMPLSTLKVNMRESSAMVAYIEELNQVPMIPEPLRLASEATPLLS